MSDFDQNQLHLDVEGRTGTPAESMGIEPESILDTVLRLHGETEASLDSAADKRGSYDLGYLALGLSASQIEREVDALRAKLSGTAIAEEPVSPSVDVSLKDRAKYLLASIDDYSAYSKSCGNTRRLEGHGASIGEIDKSSESQQYHFNNGDANFFKAYGNRALIDAGWDPNYVGVKANADATSFVDLITGPNPTNKNAREDLRKVLKSQLK